MVINLKGICCAYVDGMLCIYWYPNNIFWKISKNSASIFSCERAFAAVVAVIIIKITNDLPAARGNIFQDQALSQRWQECIQSLTL